MPPRTKHAAHRQFEPTFDRTRFWREAAEHSYDDIWVNKPVVVERYWNIDHFKGEDFLLEQNFEGRQWLGITKFNAYCVVDLVREFFANFKEGSISKIRGRERLTSWVRGVEIILTPNDLAQVFQLPRVQRPEFSYPAQGAPPFMNLVSEIVSEGHEWDAEYRKPCSILTDKYWALHIFSCSNLLPQNRNSDCTPLRARLIYAIGTGMTIDLPSYLWNHIAYVCEQPSSLTALPFGGALTEIFRRKGVQVTDDMPMALVLHPFTITSYTKSRGNMATRKRKAPKVHAHTSAPTVEESEGEQEVTNAELADRLNVLEGRMGHIERNQEMDHQLLLRIQQSQQTQEHLLQNVLDHLRDSFPPPH